jgi:Flp pilus assembly protein TadD
MNGKSIAVTGSLLAGCVLFLGCRTLRESRETEFLKPLDTATGTLSHDARVADLSEREICIETARTVAAKGHAVEAIKLYEKAEGLQPNGERFDLELAPLYVHVGNTDSAIARYRNAIAEGGASDEVFNNLAWTFMESGRHDEAIQAIQQGLDVTPESKRLQATHAVLLHKSGDREGSFEKFRKLYGESAAHHNLALLDLDSDNIESAVEHARLATGFPGCSTESVRLRDTLQTRLATTKSNHVHR